MGTVKGVSEAGPNLFSLNNVYKIYVDKFN